MILTRLRQHTAELHQQVERQVDLLSPALSRDRYVQILQAFRAFFVPWEAQLGHCCPNPLYPLWSGSRRAERLDTDLRVLRAPLQGAGAAAVQVPDLSDEGIWLGSFYVVEGSALGGQVISHHLERSFGWQNGEGYSFFRGHGTDTRAHWKKVCAALEGADVAAGNQILAGAHLTFLQLLSSLRIFL